MKTKRISFFLIIIISVLTVSCYKDVHKVDESFIGAWSSSDGKIGLEIFSESQGSYSVNGSGEIIHGKVRSNGNYLKIEDLKFSIDQPPRYDSTHLGRDYYSMILDDVTFVSGGF